jgi:arylsulfatase A-like enzyme
MRADHVGVYGYPRDTTPTIDAVANDGILFERAYAQANWTKPSVASLMTGLYVRNHGVVVGTDYFDEEGVHKVGADSFPVPDDLPLMSEAFLDDGYRTAGFVENSHLVPTQGFGRGFEIYERVKPAAFALIGWLGELLPDESFFAYLHLIGPHDPYDRKDDQRFIDEYRDRFGSFESEIDWTELAYKKKVKSYSEQDLLRARSLYDAELNYYDQEQLAPLITWLKENERYDESLIVITSDHGEELYDHGRWAHGQTLYEEVIRIPLIVKLPSSWTSLAPGTRLGEIVEQIALFPTLCSLVGCEIPASLDGRPFAELLTGHRLEDEDAFAVTEFGKGVRTQVLASTIIQGESRWIEFYPTSTGPVLRGPAAPKREEGHQSALLEAGTDELVSRSSGGEFDFVRAFLESLIGPYTLTGHLEEALGTSPSIQHELIDAVGQDEADLDELRALGYIE